MKQDLTVARAEIVELTITDFGLEHGEYFLLNTPSGQTNYYIYFKFDTSPGSGDPGFSGRIGIQVIFNVADDNVSIATLVKAGIETDAGADFTVIQENDLLTVTCIDLGYVIDSDNGTTPFDFDLSQNGVTQNTASSEVADDEKVYLIYGSNTVYGETTRTGGDGVYQFSGLTKGSYMIYVVSEDPTNGQAVQEQVAVTVGKGSDVIWADDITILY